MPTHLNPRPLISYFNLFKDYSQPWEPTFSFDDEGIKQFVTDYNLSSAIATKDYDVIEDAFARSISLCNDHDDRTILSATLKSIVDNNYYNERFINWIISCTIS